VRILVTKTTPQVIEPPENPAGFRLTQTSFEMKTIVVFHRPQLGLDIARKMVYNADTILSFQGGDGYDSGSPGQAWKRQKQAVD
jgi:hypothetical protein